MIEEYEYKGIGYGVAHATVMYFLPGIRLLPWYRRIIIPLIVFAFWKKWGYNLGRDFVFVKGKKIIKKGRGIIENWERDFGIRNNQTGL